MVVNLLSSCEHQKNWLHNKIEFVYYHSFAVQCNETTNGSPSISVLAVCLCVCMTICVPLNIHFIYEAELNKIVDNDWLMSAIYSENLDSNSVKSYLCLEHACKVNLFRNSYLNLTIVDGLNVCAVFPWSTQFFHFCTEHSIKYVFASIEHVQICSAADGSVSVIIYPAICIISVTLCNAIHLL